MVLALRADSDLQTQICGECGIAFAAPASFWAERHKNHDLRWYCPNGHVRVFAGETEAQKLTRQLAEQTKLADYLRGRTLAAEHTAKVLRGKAARSRKRVAAGVCPCCKRTFKQLAAHMGHKHPGYGKQDIG